MFSKRVTIEQVEEGSELAPKFDADGLIACVTTAAGSGIAAVTSASAGTSEGSRFWSSPCMIAAL